ncbi:putative Late nodulin [Medicago truncatula]|uniref:Nodule Cysteine-Rich (NCR) secreted peptide n=2 Tax=Medicago truncatula TaxID=3880 RepID=A7KHD4_MEDTR|nr:nodule-specific cysteine-rich peptide 289 [Medicago truncatula]AES77723.1 Nodule Cysteine-Rich (NCR) secreted peptide [Medicago truncatula]AFK45029.1 unknown [Medicago truncatula]RHN44494.1 putative Late nodulin [Medicago truncatula]
MVKIIKFVYFMTLFLSMLLVTTKEDGSVECIANIDCPQIFMLPFVMRCINFRCQIVNSEDT